MKSNLITEEEKNRILNMHKKRSANHYLVEQSILSMPETGQDVIGIPQFGRGYCEVKKTYDDLVLEMFNKLSKKFTSNQQDQLVQKWVVRLYNSMQGVGITDDFIKVLSEIRKPEQMGAVLNAYKLKYKRTLYQDVSGEYTIGWETIWKYVQFTKTIKIDYCKKYKTMSS